MFCGFIDLFTVLFTVLVEMEESNKSEAAQDAKESQDLAQQELISVSIISTKPWGSCHALTLYSQPLLQTLKTAECVVDNTCNELEEDHSSCSYKVDYSVLFAHSMCSMSFSDFDVQVQTLLSHKRYLAFFTNLTTARNERRIMTVYPSYAWISTVLLLCSAQVAHAAGGVSHERRNNAVANSTTNSSFVWVIEDTYQGKTFFECAISHNYASFCRPLTSAGSILLTSSFEFFAYLDPTQSVTARFLFSWFLTACTVLFDMQWQSQVGFAVQIPHRTVSSLWLR